MTDQSRVLTIIADANITSLDAYFNTDHLIEGSDQADNEFDDVNIIRAAGRDINAAMLARYEPQVLLIRSVTPINAALLADNQSVRFIGSATIGTDHVDQAYLATRNIPFANAAGCSKHSVAQYVLTAILSQRPEYWQAPARLGIIGLGNIGSTLARYAKDLGWEVLGYDPLLPESDINNASFDTLIKNSDVISLHVPLTDNKDAPSQHTSDYPTRHMIDASVLASMPDHTMIINSARGPVIDNQALLADIKATNRSAVLDVFETEPNIDNDLLEHLSLATPHIAGYSLEGKLRGTQMIYDALCAHFEVTPTQSMHALLPVNMYLWSELKAHPERLVKFYDIKQDDADLRAVSTDAGVVGADFDGLRRDYHLRREWQR